MKSNLHNDADGNEEPSTYMPPVKQVTTASFWDEWDSPSETFNDSSSMSTLSSAAVSSTEVVEYLSKPRIALSEYPLTWWKDNEALSHPC